MQLLSKPSPRGASDGAGPKGVLKAIFMIVPLFLMIIVLFIPMTVSAQVKPSERGLLITPPRQYLEADPGSVVKSSLTVANLTENPVEVSLAFEQFSVADYTYDYKFEMPRENWVKFEATHVPLKKTESRAVSYDIMVPKDASPGGHYFTLFASMARGDGRLVRAATVVYVTVEGDVIKRSSIVNHSLPLISFGGEIPYQLEVRNTGNSHFLIYISGKLHGLSARPATGEVAHLLMPNTVRTVKGSIAPPLIPGIYQADYGFKDEAGRETRSKRFILYAPPWSWALLGGGIWLAVLVMKRHRKG